MHLMGGTVDTEQREGRNVSLIIVVAAKDLPRLGARAWETGAGGGRKH